MKRTLRRVGTDEACSSDWGPSWSWGWDLTPHSGAQLFLFCTLKNQVRSLGFQGVGSPDQIPDKPLLNDDRVKNKDKANNSSIELN